DVISTLISTGSLECARVPGGAVVQKRIVRIDSPLGGAGHYTGPELVLLDVRLLFDHAATVSMDREARAAAGDQGAGAECDDHFTVPKHELKEVVGLGAAALPGQGGLHAVGNSE